ncbi:MAG: hypothetical protein IJ773_08675 [Lachnospiraceae bacterium]|nr:hypothetical protein [Lachnospiraceae bacterium]
MNKRKMVVAAIAMTLATGSVAYGDGRFLQFTKNGNSGMAVLDCNQNGCAAAIACADTEVGVMLKGYYTDDSEEHYYVQTTSMLDFESAAVVFHNNDTHIYYKGEASFSADGYQLGTLYKYADEE